MRTYVVVVAIVLAVGCNPLGKQGGISGLIGKSKDVNVSRVMPDQLVYGQKDFYHSTTQGAHPQRDTLNAPADMIKLGSRIYVLDSSNNRILIYENGLENAPSAVLGQTDFVTGVENQGKSNPTASSLNFPYNLATDGTKLFVGDLGNNRILIYNSAPTQTNQAADVVIGYSTFTNKTYAGAPTSTSLYWPCAALPIGGKLYVADFNHSRLLVYNSIPTTNGAAADVVIGQNDFTSDGVNRGATPTAKNLSGPCDLKYNGSKLAVADYGNNRVLIWNTPPTSDVDADVVIGQANFTSNGTGVTQSTMNAPWGIEWAGADSMYISEYYNSRVTYYSGIPASGAAGNATGVIGQANFTTATANRGASVSNNGLNYPFMPRIIDGNLYIMDSWNHRILKFNSTPTGVGTDVAIAVYGQTSFTSNKENQAATNSRGFSDPRCVAVGKDHIVVGDVGNKRYLVFNKDEYDNFPEAVAVIGQSDFTLTQTNLGGAGPTASAMNIALCGADFDDAGRLYITDRGNNRVLVFNQVPTSNAAAADFVLGQPSFTTNTADNGDGDQELQSPIGIDVHGDKLLVADYSNQRIMVWDLPITSNHQRASMVIAQPDFLTQTSGTTQLKVKNPWYAHYDGSKIYVVDSGNNRIMVWDGMPGAPNQNADYVIGQSDFTSIAHITNDRKGFYKSGGTGLHSIGFSVIDNYLLVPEIYGYRILGYNTNSLSNYMDANYVWGQTDFTAAEWSPLGNDANDSFVVNYGPSSIQDDPYDDYVWIAERYSNRVLRVKKSVFWNKKVQ